MNSRQLNALLILLEDPDQKIHHEVMHALKNLSFSDIEELEQIILQDTVSPQSVIEIQRIIHQLRVEETVEQLTNWKEGSSKSLLEAIFNISKVQYPELDLSFLKEEIEKIKRHIWLEINPKQTSFEIIQRFNSIFFHAFQFKRVPAEQIGPFAYFIPSILELREGESIGLGILYSIVAHELNIPIYGVRFPFNRFLLGYLDENNSLNGSTPSRSHGVLFYISMRENGRIMTKEHLDNYLKQVNQPGHPSFFEPASNTDIVKEYLVHIIRSCKSHLGYQKKASDYEKILTCLT